MKTKLLTPDDIDEAADIIKRGGLVAIPTETVYGLAANAFCSEAVAKIFKAKGRPMDNPLIVHIAKTEQTEALTRCFPQAAQILADRFWPGPLTLILPKSDRVPREVSAGLSTVAVRCPAHKTARELIAKSMPLAAPSANLSGGPSPTSAKHVMDDMDGRIDAILDGGVCDVGVESTVISLAYEIPRVLRPGGVTIEEIREAIGEAELDTAVMNPIRDEQTVSSPGMKYKHYAPKAKVILLRGEMEAFRRFVNSHADDGTAALCYAEEEGYLSVPTVCIGPSGDYAAQASMLFAALRECDECKYKTVYAHCPGTAGMGLALYNRIIRASGFEVIDIE